MQLVYDHLDFYQRFVLKAWHNITPMQYGYMLVAVAVTGWMMMKSGPR